MAEMQGDLAGELKRLRALSGLSFAKLGAKCGVTPAYLHQIESGSRTFSIDSEFASKLSDALKIPLSHWASFIPVPLFRPILGSIAAGTGIDREAEPGEEREVPYHLRSADALFLVRGDSMVKAGITDGSYIAVRCDPAPQHGEIAAAWVRDQGMVVKLVQDRTTGKFLKSMDGTGTAHRMGEGDEFIGVYVGVLPSPAEKVKAKRGKK